MKHFDDDFFDDDFDEDDTGDNERDFHLNDNYESATVHEILDFEYFPPLEFLDKNQLSNEYLHLLDVLEKNNIHVNFLHLYPLKERYRFITEEVFNEVAGIINYEIEGDLVFIYEEYYNDVDFFNSCFPK
jgi:hypothetical protein